DLSPGIREKSNGKARMGYLPGRHSQATTPGPHISFKQLSATVEEDVARENVLIGRLVNAHQHLLALKISDYHGMNKEVVIMHWACSKLTVSSAILDPTLLEILLDKECKLLCFDLYFPYITYYEKIGLHELMSNFFAQPDALAYGKTCNGNRPSLSIQLSSLDVYINGQLLAIYEHKIAVEGESHVAMVVLVNMNMAVKSEKHMEACRVDLCGRFVTQAMDYQCHYSETWILVNRDYVVWNWRKTNEQVARYLLAISGVQAPRKIDGVTMMNAITGGELPHCPVGVHPLFVEDKLSTVARVQTSRIFNHNWVTIWSPVSSNTPSHTSASPAIEVKNQHVVRSRSQKSKGFVRTMARCSGGHWTPNGYPVVIKDPAGLDVGYFRELVFYKVGVNTH
nr:protein vacuoleless1 [Tanacetum cinerariifolium]